MVSYQQEGCLLDVFEQNVEVLNANSLLIDFSLTVSFSKWIFQIFRYYHILWFISSHISYFYVNLYSCKCIIYVLIKLHVTFLFFFHLQRDRKEKKLYTDDWALGDDDIEGRRSFSIQEKLETDRYSQNFVKEMQGAGNLEFRFYSLFLHAFNY